jgi:hypothetical protein
VALVNGSFGVLGTIFAFSAADLNRKFYPSARHNVSYMYGNVTHQTQQHFRPLPMTLDVETAALISLFVQSILYGARCFLVYTFSYSSEFVILRSLSIPLRSLVLSHLGTTLQKWELPGGNNQNLIGLGDYGRIGVYSTRSLFIIVGFCSFSSWTLQHIGASLWRILEAFVWVSRDSTADILGSTTTKNYLLRIAVYEVQTLVGDGFMVSTIAAISVSAANHNWSDISSIHGMGKENMHMLACCDYIPRQFWYVLSAFLPSLPG